MEITFFEAFGDPKADGECTAIREGCAELGIGNDTLLNAVSGNMVCQINGEDYALVGPYDGGVWSGLVNPNTPRQREVHFLQLRPMNGVQKAVRIVILHGKLQRGEAILDVRPAENSRDMNTPSLVCFTRGSNILTAFGDVPIEHLKVGDLIHTVDHGLQPVRWIGGREVTRAKMTVAPHSKPVCIRKNAFGPYLPAQDIWVSQNHKIMIDSEDSQSLFDFSTAFASAKSLVDGRSIVQEERDHDTFYIHLLFDEHQVIYVDGLPSESFFPCPGSLMSLTPEDRRQVFDLLPNLEHHPLSYGSAARDTLTWQQVKRIAA